MTRRTLPYQLVVFSLSASACATPSAVRSPVVSAEVRPRVDPRALADDTLPPDPRAVQPERPTVATHAGTVAARYAEVETGLELDRFDDGEHGATVPTVLKIGLARRVQLSIGVPWQRATRIPGGVGDGSLGVKWRVLEGNPVFGRVAIQPTMKFQTGGTRSTRTTDGSLLLIDSWSFGPVAVDLNAGMTWRTGDGGSAPERSSIWTASFGVPVHGPLGAVIEAYGYPGTSGEAGSPPIVALLVGPTLLVSRDLALDVGIIRALQGPQPDAFYLGLVKNFGKWWH